MVARYRERTSRNSLRYEELVQYARDEGQSLRARSGIHRQSQRLASANTNTKRSVHLIDEFAQLGDDPPSQQQHQQLLYLGGDSNQSGLTSVATSELPSTEPSIQQAYLEEDQLLYTQTTKSSAIRYGDRQSSRNRPGWITKPRLVCYHCYVANKHVSPDCDLTLDNLHQTIDNYESLTEEERERVPRIAYNMAKQLEKGVGASEPSAEIGGDNHPKNV